MANFLAWEADGNSLLVPRPTPRGFALVRVGLRGNPRVLWEPLPRGWMEDIVPTLGISRTF